MRIALTMFFLVTSLFLSAQTVSNSRKFINNAAISQVARDWNIVADLTSGTGETVSFFPIEITDLKTGEAIKALQVDMSVNCRNFEFFKSSWVDLNEISEFSTFIETYVVPKLSKMTEKKKSNTYIFKSKEIEVRFMIGNFTNRLSVYLRNGDVTDEQCYFWTETQIGRSKELLSVLKTFH